MVSFCEILVFTCSVISWFVGVYVCYIMVMTLGK